MAYFSTGIWYTFRLALTGINLANDLLKNGSEAVYEKCDVSSYESVETTVEAICKKFGRIDILVNSAGISPKFKGRAPLLQEISVADWERVIGVNLSGAFYCAKAIAPKMIANNWGRIITIASMTARTYNPRVSVAYISSKTGLIGLNRKLAGELAPYGITCNVICPGRTLTPMNKTLPEHVNAEVAREIPMGRLAETNDIANAVLFLASDKAAYITGTILDVNGGHFMG